jgi:hypothetical protein
MSKLRLTVLLLAIVSYAIAQPRIDLSPRTLDFRTIVSPNCVRDSVKVKNVGNATLYITSILSTSSLFSLNPVSAAITAGESTLVSVTVCATFPIGVETAALAFNHNGVSSRDTVRLRAEAGYSGWQIQTSGTTERLTCVKAVNHE